MTDGGGRIGIICAIPQELPRLRSALAQPRPLRLGRAAAEAGSLDETPVVLIEAGLGKVNTAMTASLLVAEAGVTSLLFSGVAGGLDPDCAIGDVVIADRALHHDAGVVTSDGLAVYQAGHVPFLNPTDALGYSPPRETIAAVRDVASRISLSPLSAAAGGSGRAPEVRLGPILSGDQFVASEDMRRRLHHEHGGLAVEMEGAALAQVAEAFDVPWLNVRALSDLAGHESDIDFTAFAEEVAASSATVVRALLPALSASGAAHRPG